MTSQALKRPLPIDFILPELLEAVRSHSNCVLHAPPGAGKTTRVPLTLLDLIPAGSGRVIMLEPRRLAAVSAARWMARSLGEEAGGTVGYSIRFENRCSAATRIEVVTEGILTRRIQNDPLLEGVAMVIFDEFHERSIQADLGLALCLDVQRQVRQDLKIMVMSATLECGPIATLLGNAPVVSSAGRSFPVTEHYLEGRPDERLPAKVVAAARQALSETSGDLLVFLPGAGEIRHCAAALDEAGIGESGVAVHQLYGDLPFDLQQAAIQPGARRKVVLSTSIAESSLTIEGVTVVIDSGLSRRLKLDPASGMNRLITLRASRASAEQRKGRAGRLGPGVCYRLYSRHSYTAMTPFSPPEILDTDLAPLALELAAWGSSDPTTLCWLDVPPAASWNAARELLLLLGALDVSGRITPLGRAMANLPLHPRLSRLLLRSLELNCPLLGCDLAAMLAERDILRHEPGAWEHDCDLTERLELLHEWRQSGRTAQMVDRNTVAAVDRVARQLLRFVKPEMRGSNADIDDSRVVCLLLSAYPDRVAMVRPDGSNRYLLANGRGASLHRKGAVAERQFIVAVSVDGGEKGEGVIHLAQQVAEDLLRLELAERIECRETIDWDQQEGRVAAAREERLGALRLSSRPFVPEPAALLPVVLEAVRESGLALLPLDDDFRQLQARVMLLRTTCPEGKWPDLSDQCLKNDLEFWLGPFLNGVRNSQQLAAVNCSNALLARLEYQQMKTLQELAPTHLTVPSGSRIRLTYSIEEPPVLAVKLQELFGLAETPAVAGGRVPVLLHLLSPAGRPLQVTRDLKGFWDGSYHQVKKEMKGRYPKHPWPDDPWCATPTRRVKPKGA